MSSLQIYQWVCQWKNFENRLTFGEVMGKSLVSCFFWDTVYIRQNGKIIHKNTTTMLWPLCRSTCVSWNPQLRTTGFYWCKVCCLHAAADSNYSRENMQTVFTHTITHPFNGPLSGTTRVSRYQKGSTNLDFTEARDSEWQWHQLGHMQVCTSIQTDTTPAPHRSVFYRPDALPAAQPTVSKHWRLTHTISLW